MKLDHGNIIPECYADTNLIEYLVNGTVNHQHCCNKVVGTLRNTFRDRFAIGIIDRDKIVLEYLNQCDTVASSEHLVVWKHRSLPHFLITIQPAIDGFLLACAKEQDVDPKAFGLPSTLRDFLKRTKKTTSSKDSNLRQLIKAIRENDEIKKLKSTLQYLKEKTYQSDFEDIKAIFGN
jgi:hypothetical protein